jgi:predicted neutral ceramidase superfamily lipid hydrolase
VAGTVSQQEEHNDEKKFETLTSVRLLVSLFRMAPDDQCCHTKYLKVQETINTILYLIFINLIFSVFVRILLELVL